MSKECLEWAPFKLRPGISEAALMEAAEALQREFLEKQPGFVRRQLLRSTDNHYVDVIWWSSAEAAAAAMAKAAESSACNAYFEQMSVEHAEAGAGVALFETLRSFG